MGDIEIEKGSSWEVCPRVIILYQNLFIVNENYRSLPLTMEEIPELYSRSAHNNFKNIVLELIFGKVVPRQRLVIRVMVDFLGFSFYFLLCLHSHTLVQRLRNVSSFTTQKLYNASLTFRFLCLHSYRYGEFSGEQAFIRKRIARFTRTLVHKENSLAGCIREHPVRVGTPQSL